MRRAINSLTKQPFAGLRSFVLKMARFSLVGLVSGGVYAIMTVFCIRQAGLDPKVASIAGYLVALPCNFFGHRQFTFFANGSLSLEALRFVFMHGVNIVISVVAFAILTDALGLAYRFGIIATLLIVPVFTFI